MSCSSTVCPHVILTDGPCMKVAPGRRRYRGRLCGQSHTMPASGAHRFLSCLGTTIARECGHVRRDSRRWWFVREPAAHRRHALLTLSLLAGSRRRVTIAPDRACQKARRSISAHGPATVACCAPGPRLCRGTEVLEGDDLRLAEFAARRPRRARIGPCGYLVATAASGTAPRYREARRCCASPRCPCGPRERR